MINVLLISIVALFGLGAVLVHGPVVLSEQYVSTSVGDVSPGNQTNETSVSSVDEPSEPIDDRPVVQHVPLPEQVKAIYMSACVAGTPSFRQQLVDLINDTELNSVMIDIKDYSGTLAFAPESETWRPAWEASTCGARDMREFIASLHAQDIFVIGRITVFQDPFAAERRPDLAVLRQDGSVWADFKGLGFIDVAAREFWDNIIELSIESYNLGFDELNFDYIRYPSDGNMRDAVYPHTARSEYGDDKPANLEAFFVYLHDAMTDPENFSAVHHKNTGRDEAIPWTSADLFGMTTTNFDHLGIGQIQERTAPYFDFIAPMVYPSHYPPNWNGFANPNHYPYEVVNTAMRAGVERMQATTTRMEGFQHQRIGTSTPALYTKPAYGPERFRTWIQDFNYGGTYDAAAVRAQIQASYDAGVMSWMLWAPSNRYTREALKPAATDAVNSE